MFSSYVCLLRLLSSSASLSFSSASFSLAASFNSRWCFALSSAFILTSLTSLSIGVFSNKLICSLIADNFLLYALRLSSLNCILAAFLLSSSASSLPSSSLSSSSLSDSLSVSISSFFISSLILFFSWLNAFFASSRWLIALFRASWSCALLNLSCIFTLDRLSLALNSSVLSFFLVVFF